jgi:hypothetical protein
MWRDNYEIKEELEVKEKREEEHFKNLPLVRRPMKSSFIP